jgi:predicted dinucleotide-binding enzyme
MTTVGIIGSGNVGITVARLAVDAGHLVVLSNSRGPETLADTAADLGPRAAATTSGEAAAAGDIVVVAVPVKAFPDLGDGHARVGHPVRADLEREGPAGRRGRHPRGTGRRNAVAR